MHDTILHHVESSLASWTIADRVACVEARRADFRHRDDPRRRARYDARTSWLKVLPSV